MLDFYSNFLIIRRLNQQYKKARLSLASLFSIVAVGVACFALVLVSSVMDGFQNQLTQRLVALQSPLKIKAVTHLPTPFDAIAIQEKISNITATAPYIELPVMLQHKSHINFVSLQGINFSEEKRVSKLDVLTYESLPTSPQYGLVIGKALSESQQLSLGDTVLVIDPVSLNKQRFVIQGIYNSGLYLYDAHLIYTKLQTSLDVFKLNNSGLQFKVNLINPYLAEQVKQDLKNILPVGYSVSTWMKENQGLLETLKVERSMMLVILSVLIVMAGFCIISSLSLQILDKKKQLAILRTLGLSSANLFVIFLSQALLLSLTGQILGISLGCAAAVNINELLIIIESTLNISLFPDSMYYLNYIPVKITVKNIAYILTFSSFTACVAAFIPIKQALNLDPIKQIKQL